MTSPGPLSAVLVAAAVAATALAPALTQSSAFFPVDAIRPGMVATGQTVFEDGKVEPFRAHVIGVLKNTIGPRRDLVLARLEGGPLATTGVIQGMSGSPVYIDGRLLGAVSYSLGSFPKEPIAGITPIGEMIDAVEDGRGRTAPRQLDVTWPATEVSVFAALRRLARQASSPLSSRSDEVEVIGPASLAALAPAIRPIGSAMVVSGFDPEVERDLAGALGVPDRVRAALGSSSRSQTQAPSLARTLRPGEAVGMSLLRGDIEMGATGTVTHVDGTRVYAFGHPFLNLGTTQFAMTRSHVYTVLPSLDSSMKISSLGPVIGVMGQDRTTAVGGRLGAGPPELRINLTLDGSRAPTRRFTYYAIHDPQLTPLFAFVAIFNTLTGYERQTGELSAVARGSVTFGDQGRVELDDIFAGDGAAGAAAGALTAAIGLAATNPIQMTLATTLDLDLKIEERQDASSIERIWLDTVKPRAGAVTTLYVQLRHFRGALETVSMPVTMPAGTTGPLTLMVSDGATLAGLERRELTPGRATSWPALLAEMRSVRASNRLYVRLIAGHHGTVVGGDTFPSLPASMRSALAADAAASQAALSKAVVGAWERRFDRAVRGSRELTLTLRPAQ